MTDERPTRELPGGARVEAFSDGVFAIALTLLVLDLRSDFDRGGFAHQLAAQWPTYLAYLAAFLNIAAIWISHHDLFHRVRAVDARLNCLNLLLLLVSSLFPWPAAVLSAAEQHGDQADRLTACLLFAGIGICVPLAFRGLYAHLLGSPDLLEHAGADDTYLRAWQRGSLVSVVAYPLAAAFAFFVPLVSLLLFLALPAFFIASVFLTEKTVSVPVAAT